MADSVAHAPHERNLPICNVAEIEEELRGLWRDVAQQHQSSDHVVTRVCTLTLIAYGADTALAKRVKRAVPALFTNHPCRAVVIDAAGQEEELSALVTTVCKRPDDGDDGDQVCCEQIILTVGEGMRRRLPGTVLPLVVSDLPLFVWWPGPWRAASTVRSQLLVQADRWIIDSADFHDPLGEIAQLVEQLKGRHTAAVSDLAWARLTPWRTSVAQVFDQPQFRPMLEALDRVELRAGQQPIQALLAAGWLATRLDWQVGAVERAGDQYRVTIQAPHGPIDLNITLTASADPVPALELHSAAREQEVWVDAGPLGSTLVVTTRSGDDSNIHVNGLPAADDSTLLDTELNVHGPDRGFEEVLWLLGRLAAQL